MHFRSLRRIALRTLVCSAAFVPLLAGPASAQPAQSAPSRAEQPALPEGTSPAGGVAPAAPSAMSMEAYLPTLPPSVVPPRLAAPSPCRFPRAAYFEHPTRPTVVTFTVTSQGRVANAAVAQSSGSSVVDDAVRDCISAFIYAPAMRDGAPTDISWAWEYSLTVSKGRVPTPAPPPDAPPGTKFVMLPVQKYRSSIGDCERWHGSAPHGVLVAFDVETDGSVKNASVAGSSGDAATDKDAVECVSRRSYKPATRDGEPVEFRLTALLYGSQR